MIVKMTMNLLIFRASKKNIPFTKIPYGILIVKIFLPLKTDAVTDSVSFFPSYGILVI